MWHCIGVWLSNHEWLAIWLEGVALVLIFVWDRIDANGEHQERMAQIEITRQQAEAARLSAQSVMNSERAWVTVGLRWSARGRVLYSSNPSATTTQASLVLDIRNDGRTPAWIKSISIGMEISGRQKQPEGTLTQYIEPVAAGQSREIELVVACPDKPQQNENLNLHVKIHYRDIFESRDMVLEFIINPHTYAVTRLEKVKVNFGLPS